MMGGRTTCVYVLSRRFKTVGHSVASPRDEARNVSNEPGHATKAVARAVDRQSPHAFLKE